MSVCGQGLWFFSLELPTSGCTGGCKRGKLSEKLQKAVLDVFIEIIDAKSFHALKTNIKGRSLEEDVHPIRSLHRAGGRGRRAVSGGARLLPLTRRDQSGRVDVSGRHTGNLMERRRLL